MPPLYPSAVEAVPPVLLLLLAAPLRLFLAQVAFLWRLFRLSRAQVAFPALLSLPAAKHFHVPLPIPRLFEVVRHSPLCRAAPSISRWKVSSQQFLLGLGNTMSISQTTVAEP